MSMKSIQILSRLLYIANRKGDYDKITFPVLKISLSEKDYTILNSHLNDRFIVGIQGFEIMGYNSAETQGVLYTDKTLYISGEDDGYFLYSYHPISQ